MSRQRVEDVLGDRLNDHATGNCYQSAFNFVYVHEDWTLVHGRAVVQGGKFKGMDFGHAWAEKDDVVMDTESGLRIPKDLYYRVGEVGETKRYTFNQAREMAVKHGHYGAWE